MGRNTNKPVRKGFGRVGSRFTPDSFREANWALNNNKPRWAKIRDGIRDGIGKIVNVLDSVGGGNHNRRLSMREIERRDKKRARQIQKNPAIPLLKHQPSSRGFNEVISNVPIKRILQATAAAAVLTLSGTTAKMSLNNYTQGNKTNEAVAELMDDSIKVESLTPGQLKPETERSGANIMMIAAPSGELKDQLHPLKNELERSIFPILDALESRTHIHLSVPYGEKDEYKELITSLYPNLEFSFYEGPMPIYHGAYAQDRFFFTGQRDNEGRFEMVTSEYDFALKKGVDYGMEAWYDTTHIADRASMAFSDDLMAKNYPDQFKRTVVSPYLIGGDMLPIRLPDGRSAIVMGRDALANNVSALRIHDREPIKHVKGRVSDTQMRSYISRVKRSVKESMGVDEVIVLGEAEIFEDDSGFTYLDKVTDERLFHADMLVRPVKSPHGEDIAFLTDADEKMARYINSTKVQFEELGYKIVDMPVGPIGTLNYTNSVIFSPEPGKKVVLLPQYGIPEDALAKQIYEEEGFEVRTVDYSFLTQEISPDDAKTMGSVHCTTVVMD